MSSLRRLLSLVLVGLLASCARASQPPALPALARAETVFISRVGDGSDGALAAETLRSELARRGPLRPIADSVQADVVLVGDIRVRRPESPGQDFYPVGRLYLVAPNAADTLWRHQYLERAPLGLVRRGQPPGEHIVTMVLQFVDRLQRDRAAAQRRAP